MFFFVVAAEREVGKISTEVLVTEGKARIELDHNGFYEKRMINKRKQWIMDGLDPDEEEKKLLKRKKFKKNKKKKTDETSKTGVETT